MRSIHLILAGIVILSLGVFVAIRQSTSNAEDTKNDSIHQVAHSTATRQSTKSMNGPMDDAKETTPPKEIVSEAKAEMTHDTPMPAIQLAAEVQLPAVIVALSAAKNNPDSTTPAPIAAAMQAIVDTFYRDLAASSKGASGDTLLIQPGPHVDRARDRANEKYRLPFGHDAFNKMMLNAAVEARLPVETSSDGN